MDCSNCNSNLSEFDKTREVRAESFNMAAESNRYNSIHSGTRKGRQPGQKSNNGGNSSDEEKKPKSIVDGRLSRG